MDISRHSSVFNPDLVTEEIHVIGAGATGSFIIQMLARMGVRNINIYDFDIVEIHNIPNQSFDTSHLGILKTEAIKEIVTKINGDINITTHNYEVTAEHIANMSGYLFLLVDSMSTRKKLWEAVKVNDKINYCWESRLGSDQARVYFIDMHSRQEYQGYESDFYEDDVAEVSACGTSITVLPVVLQTASLMMVQFIKTVMDRTAVIPFKIIFDNMYNKYEEYWLDSEIEPVSPEVQEDIF